MSAPDYYRVLGVARTASAVEMRAAYARLAKRHHPDVAGDLPARLHEIQHAYRCLSDPATRAEHDRSIAERERLHVARQRRLHKRLDRYDRHHPLPPPPWYRRWQAILVIGSGAAAIVWLAIGLFGAEPG